MKPHDAYFAGFVDGEGCISFSAYKSKPDHHRLMVQTVNSDLGVLEKMQERFSGRIYSRPRYAIHHKQTWVHRVVGYEAYMMIEAIRPHLIVKAARAEEVMATLGGPPKVRARRGGVVTA